MGAGGGMEDAANDAAGSSLQAALFHMDFQHECSYRRGVWCLIGFVVLVDRLLFLVCILPGSVFLW